MRQSQIEIKSIEAELRSIRADANSASRLVSLLEASAPAESSLLARSESLPIAPLIERQGSAKATEATVLEATVSAAHPAQPNVQPKRREVECFPISTPIPTDATTQIQLSALIEQLRRHSGDSDESQSQAASASRQGAQPEIPQSNWRQIDAIHLLEEKANQINHLSIQQETAILELMKISGQLEQKYHAVADNSEQSNELLLECEIAGIPYVERDEKGVLVLTNRSLDRVKARNAKLAATAQPSRHRSQNRVRTGWFQSVRRWVGYPTAWLGATGASLLTATARLKATQAAPRRKGYRVGRRAVTSVETPFTLKQAVTLVVGAALLRVALDWIVVSYPVLWIPSILVMLTPAAFAIYRSTVKPPTGFAWGYRLFSILIGLLLGGRL